MRAWHGDAPATGTPAAPAAPAADANAAGRPASPNRAALLRKAFEQPSGSLSDFIRAALGLYQLPSRQQRVERVFNVWVAENSSSINPDQARLLSLLRNVVSAAVTETKYVPLDPSIFTRPPFTYQGGRARAEALFGRDRLVAIMQELSDLIAAA